MNKCCLLWLSLQPESERPGCFYQVACMALLMAF